MNRTYSLRTYGCQMNVHDSERLAGLLEDAGYVRGRAGADARRRRAQHLRGPGERRQQAVRQPGTPRPGQGVAAPACRSRSAAASRRRTAGTSSRRPWVDVVFGTHNIGSLPVLLERARHNEEAQVEILESLDVFPSTLPTRRDARTRRGSPSASAATTRARSASCRRCAAPRRTAARVTSSPRSKPLPQKASSRSRCSGRTSTPMASTSASAVRSLSCCAPAVTSTAWSGCGSPVPHPRDFTDDVIEAMAETPNVMPSAAHAAAVRVRRRAQADAALLPLAIAISGSSSGCAPPSPTRR